MFGSCRICVVYLLCTKQIPKQTKNIWGLIISKDMKKQLQNFKALETYEKGGVLFIAFFIIPALTMVLIEIIKTA